MARTFLFSICTIADESQFQIHVYTYMSIDGKVNNSLSIEMLLLLGHKLETMFLSFCKFLNPLCSPQQEPPLAITSNADRLFTGQT